jgi:hypothetical protein
MKRLACLFFFSCLVLLSTTVPAQTKKSREQLEKDKIEIQIRLKEFDAILKQTTATKKTSLGQLNAITNQFQSQNRLVTTLDREVNLLSNDIFEIENEIL